MGAQLVLLVLWRLYPAGDDGSAPSGLLLLALALAGFLYLTVGASQALADGRDVVGLRRALWAGVTSYGPFLWLITKLLLLSALLLNIVLLVAGISPGQEPPNWYVRAARYLPLVEGLVAFMFVYWMPIVFVRRDFALFATLRGALVAAWRRLPQSGFPGFLILTPAALAFLADASVPLPAIMALNLAGGYMEWVAYIFCVEWLQDQAPIDP